MDNYYVYVLYLEDCITPFYIGKGSGRRIGHHEPNAVLGRSRKDDIICSMKERGIRLPKQKLAMNLSHTRACQLEIALISRYGRECDGGILTNVTLGGEGRAAVISNESRAKISAAHKGKKLSPEHCAKMSAQRIGKPNNQLGKKKNNRISR